MILTLKNFKCFKDAEFVFRENDEKTLITSQSGFGKSSIFDAIKFVFWGSKDTEIVTFGKRKCEVTLQYKNYIIKRTKNPNFLVITTLDGQEVPDPSVFLETHFQQYPLNFLSQSNTKQKLVLENITMATKESSKIKNKNIEEFKDTLKSIISDGNKKINILKNTIEVLQSSLSKFPKPKNIEKPITNIKHTEQSCLKKIKELTSLVQKYLTDKNLYEEYTNELDSIDISGYNNNDIKQLNRELEDKKQYQFHKIEISKKIKFLEQKLANINKEELEEKIVTLKSHIDVVENIKQKISELWNSVDSPKMTNDKLNTFIKEYKEIPGKYKCPGCKKSLNICEKTNQLVYSNTCKDIDKLREIQTLNEQYKQYNQNYDKLKGELNICEMSLINFKKLEKNLEKLAEYPNDYTDEIKKINEHLSNIIRVQSLKNKLSSIKNHSQNDIDGVNSEIKNYTEYLDKIKNYNKDLKIWEENEKLKNTVEDMEKDIQSKEFRLKYCLEIYENTITLKNIIEAAQMKSLTSFIKTMNNEIKYFVDIFFTEEIVVKFQESKKQGKSELDFTIFYKGTFMKLHNLSTGERARVELAIDLVLYKLINTTCPLLLDEVTANLDGDLSSLIFQTIYKYFKGTNILIIAHQAVEGIFDNVLTEEILTKCIKQ